jgi:3-oxoadipate enol-lactonase
MVAATTAVPTIPQRSPTRQAATTVPIRAAAAQAIKAVTIKTKTRAITTETARAERQSEGMVSRLGESGLNVEQAGSGDPVVLIHGVTLDVRMWLPQVPLLSKQFRVIRYDLRGFGRSERPTKQNHRHRDDLKLLLDELRIPKAHLVGLSRGGRVALEFATLHPDRVLKLVLIDPAIRYKEKKKESKQFPQDVYRLRTIKFMKKAADAWLKAPIWKSPGQRRIRPKIEKMVREFFAWEHIFPKPELEYSRISTLKAPTLILVGDHESKKMTRAAEDLHKKLQRCQHQVVPKAGHIANVDNARFVNKELLKFLKDAKDD